MNSFNQKREPHFWFTHLFLIISLATAYTLSKDNQGHIVLCLIAADGAAALMGKHFGRIKIYGEKTLEGTLSFALTFLASLMILQDWKVADIIIAVGCSLAELLSGDADNLATLYTYYVLNFLI